MHLLRECALGLSLLSLSLAQDELVFSVTIRDFLPSACMRALGDNDNTGKDDLFRDVWDNVDISLLSGDANSRCSVLLDNGGNNQFRQALFDGVVSGHPDFEVQDMISGTEFCNDGNFPVGSCVADAGRETIRIVGDTLEAALSGLPKPPYCSDTERCGRQNTRISDRAGTNTFTQSTQEFFDMWYNDDRAYNRRIGTSLTLDNIGGTTFQNDAGDFFGPLDQFKSGGNAISVNENPLEVIAWPQSFASGTLSNNGFWFTTELHTTFQFDSDGDMLFTFSGDDDFWAYINGQLAIDIGGVHSRREAEIDLNSGNIANVLGLQDGQVYTLDVFHAERQTVQSNFLLTTNLFPACNVIQSGTPAFDFSSINDDIIADTFFAHPEIEFNSAGSNSFLLQKDTDLGSGTFIYTLQQENVGRGFRATFTVSLSGPAEGFAFVVQRDTLDDYPISTGDNFNFLGLRNSFAVVFDLCRDRDDINTDCSDKRVSVHYPEPGDSNAENEAGDGTLRTRDSLFGALTSFDVEIVYFGGQPDFLEVTIDNSLYLREADFPIEDILGGGGAFVGLTASASTERAADIQISDWTLQTVEVDPVQTVLDFDVNNIPTQDVVADGISQSEGLSFRTRDACVNDIDAGTLAALVDGKYIEVPTTEDAQGRKLQATYANGSTFPDVRDATIVDNEDGTYNVALVTDVIASYRLAFTFGEGCTVDVPIDQDSTEFQEPSVQFNGGADCFTVDVAEGVVDATDPGEAPTRSPTQEFDEGTDETLITTIASVGGVLLCLGLIAAMVLVRYRKKWNKEKGYVATGNQYKMEANTAFDQADEYTKTGKELLRTQEEILRLQAQAQADRRDGDIAKLKSENANLKSLIRDSRQRLSNQPDLPSTSKPAVSKNRKRQEF